MDGSRFDSLARSLAGSGSRRRFVAGLAAGAVGLLGGRAARAADAPDHCAHAGAKAKPDKRKGCCPGLVEDATGRCAPDPCAGVACAPQDECHGAACDPASGGCVQTALTGPSCAEGVCQSGACVCGSVGAFCTSEAMCCPGLGCELFNDATPVNRCI